MHFSKSTAAVLAAAIPLAAAQTYTSCNPLEKTCPSDPGLNQATWSVDFTKGASNDISEADGTTLTYGSNGAEFTINKAGQAPTVSSDFYFLFGRVDVVFKAAPGTGIVSSIVLESDDLDEIDLEFLGGNTAQVETNFFGKGNTTLYNRATYVSVATPQTLFHTYTIDWSPQQLVFSIDGTVVRTLPYDSPLALGGSNYPQTPMRLKLGNWVGGGPGEAPGTVEWAGGETDFSQAPFSMYVKSVSITNANPASSYTYGDKSGTWQSIKIANGTSSSGSSSVSGSTTGTATSSITSLPVAPLSGGSGLVAPTTLTGSAHSTNTASIAAQNTGSSNATVSGTPSPTASHTPNTNGAAAMTFMTGGSLLSVALAALLL